MMFTSGIAVHGELIGFFADTVSEEIKRLLLILKSRSVNAEGVSTAADRFQLIRA
jgi:hypothetical protein